MREARDEKPSSLHVFQIVELRSTPVQRELERLQINLRGGEKNGIRSIEEEIRGEESP